MEIFPSEKVGFLHFFVQMNVKNPKRTDKVLAVMIIQRMKELRMNNNHTQEYVSANTGLDLPHFENGRDVPSVVSLSIFCKFYNITLDEFFAPLNYPAKK